MRSLHSVQRVFVRSGLFAFSSTSCPAIPHHHSFILLLNQRHLLKHDPRQARSLCHAPAPPTDIREGRLQLPQPGLVCLPGNHITKLFLALREQLIRRRSSVARPNYPTRRCFGNCTCGADLVDVGILRWPAPLFL